MNNISLAALIVSLLVGSGGLGVLIRFNTRLTVLEELFKDKKETLQVVRFNQEGMNTRLAVVESALSKIEEMRKDMMSRKEIESRFDVIEALLKR